MSDDEPTVEVEAMEEEAPVREDLMEPPPLTPGNIADVIRRKGFVGAMQDEAMGPHIHLVTVLGVVVIIAIGVAVMGAF